MAISNRWTGYSVATIVAGYKVSKWLVVYIIKTVYFNAIALEICETLISDSFTWHVKWKQFRPWDKNCECERKLVCVNYNDC